jgi:hypothetical protein
MAHVTSTRNYAVRRRMIRDPQHTVCRSISRCNRRMNERMNAAVIRLFSSKKLDLAARIVK